MGLGKCLGPLNIFFLFCFYIYAPWKVYFGSKSIISELWKNVHKYLQCRGGLGCRSYIQNTTALAKS